LIYYSATVKGKGTKKEEFLGFLLDFCKDFFWKATGSP